MIGVRFLRLFLNRRFLILLTLIAFLAFGIGTVIAQTLPKIKSTILVTVDRLSREHLPVRILPGSVELSFFPLGVTLKEVRLLPTAKFETILSPLTISELSADLSLLQIVRGEVALSRLSVSGTAFSVTVPPLPDSHGKPLEGLFKALNSIPIFEIELKNINAQISIPAKHLKLDFEQLGLVLERGRRQFKVKAQAESILAVDQQGKRGLRISPELEFDLAPNFIEFNRVDLRRGASVIRFNGRLDGDIEGLRFDSGTLDSEMEFDIKSTRDWLQKSIADAEPTPPMTGTLQLRLKADKTGRQQPWKSEIQLRAHDYSVQGIWIDKIEANGVWDGEQLTVPELKTESVAGKASLSAIRIGQGSSPLIDGRTPWLMRIGALKVGVELHDFMTKMGVGPIPVWLTAEGEFPCESRLVPQFNIRCGGSFRGKDAIVQGELVRGRTPKGAIAGIPQFEATGEFTFDLEKFTYQADIKMPNSAGRSSGEVYYQSGFKLKYEADRFSLKDMSSLGDLKLEGTLKLKGETSGDSQAATFFMQADAQDLWLEDFWLGYPKAAINYKAGGLSFKGIQGFYSTTRYSGDFAIDFKTNTLSTQMRVPFFDSRDLLKVFSRKFTLPVPLTGTGQASIKANGPFALNRLSYDLKSSLFKGMVSGENFDVFHFDVKSTGGEVRSERIQLNRGTASIQMTGTGHPDGTINAEAHGRDFKLEETNLISESGFALAGLFNFDMTLKGPVLLPDATMKGTVTHTSIAETTVPDTSCDLRFTSRSIEGKGQFLGDLVTGEFVWPLTPDSPLSLQFQSRDWNFAPIFSALAGPKGRRDFEGHLTSKLSLSAARGGFWASSGSASIEKLALKRGAIELANQEPIEIIVHNGVMDIIKFEVLGENTFLRLSNREGGDNSGRTHPVDLSLSSKIDMNLLSIFTPFFEELRGLLSMAISIKAGPAGTDVIGSALVERGFLKFPEFNYPFENIQSDVAFNHKKVVINSLKSDFASGKIQASGGLEIVGKKQVPVNVAGTFDRISLNLPNKIKTNGSGDFSFSGNWFPYLLKGNYIVKDGLMAKDFGDNDSAGSSDNLKRDQFLPRFLVEESFLPIVVDVKVDLSNGLALKNDMVEGSAQGQLRILGNPTKAAIEGQIRTTGETKVNFRENIFTVTSAVLNFEDPLEINPKINVQARARVDSYNVSLLVQGQAKKPEISLSSIPPLSERDLLSLLALGATDQQLDSSINSQQQGSSAGFQVLSAVANPLVKKVTEQIGLNVQYSAGFDKTDESAQRIIVKKEFNRKLGVSGSQTWGKKLKTEGRAHYRLSDKTSVVVSVQGQESGDTADTTDQEGRSQNKLGLDFEYKFEFK